MSIQIIENFLGILGVNLTRRILFFFIIIKKNNFGVNTVYGSFFLQKMLLKIYDYE